METYDMSPDQLLAAFLDACRDDDRDAATDAIHELRYRVWAGVPLPKDIRPHPEEQAELRRISALWREERRKQTGGVPTIRRDSDRGFGTQLTDDEYAKIRADNRKFLKSDAPFPWSPTAAEEKALRERTRDPGKGFHAIPRTSGWNATERRRKEHYPFCVDPVACIANGRRCPRDPVCGN